MACVKVGYLLEHEVVVYSAGCAVNVVRPPMFVVFATAEDETNKLLERWSDGAAVGTVDLGRSLRLALYY